MAGKALSNAYETASETSIETENQDDIFGYCCQYCVVPAILILNDEFEDGALLSQGFERKDAYSGRCLIPIVVVATQKKQNRDFETNFRCNRDY